VTGSDWLTGEPRRGLGRGMNPVPLLSSAVDLKPTSSTDRVDMQGQRAIAIRLQIGRR
jgi:hypothetical protein